MDGAALVGSLFICILTFTHLRLSLLASVTAIDLVSFVQTTSFLLFKSYIPNFFLPPNRSIQQIFNMRFTAAIFVARTSFLLHTPPLHRP